MRSTKFFKKTLIYLTMTLLAIFSIGPLLWFVNVSLKPDSNVFSFSLSIMPDFSEFSLGSYKEVFSTINFNRYIFNSILIAVGGSLINVVLSCLTAYPLAMYNFKGKNILFGAIIGTLIVPATAGYIVNYITIIKFGLKNTYMAAILPTAITTFNVFLMKQAYTALSKDLREAARIDGASELRIFGQIMLPTVKPAITVIFLFQFMAYWNDYLWPVIVLEQEKYPLSPALGFLKGQFGGDISTIAAGAVMSIVPMIIVFLIFQKYFTEGMAGALKG